MTLRETDFYKELSAYDAVAIAEGFSDIEPTEEQVLCAWQKIIDTGLTSSLQGWFGRSASALIESGLIEAK